VTDLLTSNYGQWSSVELDKSPTWFGKSTKQLLVNPNIQSNKGYYSDGTAAFYPRRARQGHMNCSQKTFVKPEEARHANRMSIYLSKNSTPDGLETSN
jgi:hypothetical protein